MIYYMRQVHSVDICIYIRTISECNFNQLQSPAARKLMGQWTINVVYAYKVAVVDPIKCDIDNKGLKTFCTM